jgi:hypothetical protein
LFVKRIVLVAIVATFLGCTSTIDRSPLAPSNSSANLIQQLSWGCLTNPESCGLATASTISASAELAAGPVNFAAIVSGSSVSLSWQPPAGVSPTGYLLEAGSAPGRTDIVMFVLLSPGTGLSVGGVPSGTYYARVRAIVSNAFATEPSNEVAIVVGGGGAPPPPGGCAPTVSPANPRAPAAGGNVTLNVTATCAWTAQSHSSFMTIVSGASGVGNGTITVSFAANSGGTRQGVLTINGQAVVVTQDSGLIAVAFDLYDPATQASATTECRFRSNPSTCQLRSTSFPRSTNTLASYTWSLQYTYGTVKTITQTETAGTLSFSDVCGGEGSTAEGAAQPLSVTLTVTDNTGATASATSGSGNQPALFVRLFTCP